MTIIQVMGIAIDSFDDPELEGESMGVKELGVVRTSELVASSGGMVVVVDRACEEMEAEINEKVAELEGIDEKLEGGVEFDKA